MTLGGSSQNQRASIGVADSSAVSDTKVQSLRIPGSDVMTLMFSVSRRYQRRIE
jgi:hypothetical protein